MSIFNRGITERKLYFFKCSKCGNEKRQSFFKERATKKLCAICRRGKVNEDQIALLPEESDENEMVEKEA